MTTKQYLSQIGRYERMIDDKLTELYRLRQIASSISISVSDDKIMSSGSQDKMGDAVAKIVDLEKSVEDTITKYTGTRQKIIMQIDNMPDINVYSVLFNRYVANKSFEKIADSIGYSVRQTIRIHGIALQEFEKIYGSEYLSLNVIECH